MDNYFIVLGLKPEFTVNLNALEERYFEIQRNVHPDRQIGKSEAERVAAIEHSMRANDAYETLKNPLTRAQHLLEIQGIFVNTEDDTQKPEPALLMEMMELREQLADAAQDGAALRGLVEDTKKAMQQCIDRLEEAFDAADYPFAANLTLRLQYLGKALEEAHMLIYRLKALHTHEAH
jgi:molecular chaperone HscB